MEKLKKRGIVMDDIQVKTGKKQEALRIISHFLAKEDFVNELIFMRAFWEREQLDSTGFGGGIAIPHALIKGDVEPMFAVVRFSQPVEWEALDEQPVDIAIALVTPEKGTDNQYLSMLAMLARKLMDEEFVFHLRGCADEHQLYEYIVDELGW